MPAFFRFVNDLAFARAFVAEDGPNDIVTKMSGGRATRWIMRWAL